MLWSEGLQTVTSLFVNKSEVNYIMWYHYLPLKAPEGWIPEGHVHSWSPKPPFEHWKMRWDNVLGPSRPLPTYKDFCVGCLKFKEVPVQKEIDRRKLLEADTKQENIEKVEIEESSLEPETKEGEVDQSSLEPETKETQLEGSESGYIYRATSQICISPINKTSNSEGVTH